MWRTHGQDGQNHCDYKQHEFYGNWKRSGINVSNETVSAHLKNKLKNFYYANEN